MGFLPQESAPAGEETVLDVSTRKSSLVRALATNPHLSFFYSDRAKGVTLHRAYDVLLMGWIATRSIRTDGTKVR